MSAVETLASYLAPGVGFGEGMNSLLCTWLGSKSKLSLMAASKATSGVFMSWRIHQDVTYPPRNKLKRPVPVSPLGHAGANLIFRESHLPCESLCCWSESFLNGNIGLSWGATFGTKAHGLGSQVSLASSWPHLGDTAASLFAFKSKRGKRSKTNKTRNKQNQLKDYLIKQ